MAVVVPASSKKPHFSGPAYIRVGSKSRKANEEAYEELKLNVVDKCRALLRHKGEVCTVEAIGKKLGETKPLNDSRYREGRECHIESCNARSVSFRDIGQNTLHDEPLDNVVAIVQDYKRNRPKLVVKPVVV